jgi:antitoxin component YwqK of YwqJK toxin-antitoxin module
MLILKKYLTTIGKTVFMLSFLLSSCNSIIQNRNKWFCKCANVDDYKPFSRSGFIVIKLDNGDSLCSSSWKYEVKTNFDKNVNGIFKLYHFNGNLKWIVPIKKGRMDGESFFYYENGNILSTSHYVDGESYGETIIYHANGKVSHVAYYYKSIPVGRWSEYDTTGMFIRDTVYGKKPQMK